MKIQIRITTQYGNRRIVPVCETAVLLCRLTGNKTFTDDAVDILKKLGYEFVVETPTL